MDVDYRYRPRAQGNDVPGRTQLTGVLESNAKAWTAVRILNTSHTISSDIITEDIG